uniref:Uncharacterized protein n=1 Tax=Ditylenchus dipsaci TaxID=166011 RepID=A0A915DNB9_9BILA
MPIKSEYPDVPVATEPFSGTFSHALWQHFSENPHKPALINAQNEQETVTFGEVILQGGAITGANQQSTQYEIKQQLEDSRSQVVFCSNTNLTCVLEAVKQNSRIKAVIVVGASLNDEYENQQPHNPLVISFNKVLHTEPAINKEKVKPNVDKDILILPYSSGTTGIPKGVMISHKNFGTMMNLLTNQFNTNVLPYIDKDFDYRKENQMLMLPFYHIYGFGMLINCLLNGSTGIILEKFEHQIFCKSIEKYKFRILMVVPPVLVWMAKSESILKYDISSVQLLFSGAAPAGKDLCQKLCSKFPSLKFIAQAYGMTELIVRKINSQLGDENFRLSDRGRSRKGMPGELHYRGPTIMMGYFNRPEATAETIDSEGWMKTGDVGYLDKDNFLYIIDRRKELIKVKGFQVAPAELEDVLLSHPNIKDCAVIGVPDRFSGELPKAYVVKANENLNEQEVLDFIKDKLAYYKHLKGGVEFIEEIPKSPAGKILRRFLRDMHCQKNKSKL